MKKLIFILISFCLLCGTSAGAFDAITGFGAGALMQANEQTTTMYHVELKVPIVSHSSAGYQISLEGAAMYTDRGLGEVSEIEGQRVFSVGEKQISKSISALLGGGVWRLTDSEGDNQEYSAITFGGLSKILGIELSLRCDMVLLPKEKDLFYPYAGLRLIGL